VGGASAAAVKYTDIGDTLTLLELVMTLSLAEIYDDITF
jgi:hypothetical protein